MTGAWYEAGGSTSRAATWALEAALIEGARSQLPTWPQAGSTPRRRSWELPAAACDPTVLEPPTAVLEGHPEG